MNVLVFIVFGIFVVCGIVGTVYFNKMVNILKDENVPTTFADRCFFPFNMGIKKNKRGCGNEYIVCLWR